MAVSVAEIIARRKLTKQNEMYFDPGQHKAVMVEDKALLSWVDSVGQLIMLTATKEETSPGFEEWVVIKPAHAILIALDGTIQARPFAVSYRFDDQQTNALNEAAKKRKKSDED
jgi:hypothetical protein